MNPLRISFCTTAMGRLDHIRQTFLHNIEQNSDYPDAEFVLLDYGSKDGLGDWVKSNVSGLLDGGRVVYLRLDGVDYYSHCHSKNICFLASSGTILCNVDADNRLPRGFAFHIVELLLRHPKAFAGFDKSPRNAKGRLALFRTDFLQVGGYDEALSGWGYDDRDLRARLMAAGGVSQVIDSQFAAVIPHGNERRLENMAPHLRSKGKTNVRNRCISVENLANSRFIANTKKNWGAAVLCKNFIHKCVTGVHS